MYDELSGNVPRRGRVARQNVQHLAAVFDPSAAGDPYAEHDFLARVVKRRPPESREQEQGASAPTA